MQDKKTSYELHYYKYWLKYSRVKFIRSFFISSQGNLYFPFSLCQYTQSHERSVDRDDQRRDFLNRKRKDSKGN